MSNRPDAADAAVTIPIVQTLGMDQVRLLVEMLSELNDDEAAQMFLSKLDAQCEEEAKPAV